MTEFAKLPFQNRTEAGKALASRLNRYQGRDDVVVLALPRGGVPVAAEVAQRINAPLDVFVVRKLGTPGHEELAMGAVATGGARVVNEEVVRQFGVPDFELDKETRKEELELARQEKDYRGKTARLDVRDKTVILVDDGLATGYSMRAAVQGLRQLGPGKVVAAVPVASREGCEMLETEADEVICAETPRPFLALSEWYQDFHQVTDQEIQRHLSRE